MLRMLQTGAMMSIAMAMAACTTARPYNRIDAPARAHIQDMDSVLISKQTDIRADIKVSKISSYLQGHFAPILLDIAVNSFRSHKAGKHIEPIRETLADYDYTQDIKQEFNQALAESGLADMGELKVLRNERQGFRAAYIRQSDADAVMFIDVGYAFTPNFDALNLTSRIMVFPVDPALSPYKERPDTDNYIEYEDNIYRNQFAASIPVDWAGTTSENAAAWAEMSEEKLSGLMQAAAHKLAGHIAQDLNIDDVSEDEVVEETVEQEIVTEDEANEMTEPPS